MKVTIKDPEFLSSKYITPSDLENYLIRLGFKLVGEKVSEDDESSVAKTYESPYMNDRHRSCSVVVLTDVNHRQYEIIMASNLAQLELFTNSSQLQVYVEIRQIPMVFTPEKYFFDVFEDVVEQH